MRPISAWIFLLAVPPQSGEISGSFQGVLPCADCPGIDDRVDLFPDHAYYLRASYLERESAFDDVGSWALSSDGRTLVLKGGREAPLFFTWVDGGRALVNLDTEGNPIESSHHKDLLANVEGRIVERVNMEGPARPMLVVERFLSVSLDETCGARFAAKPFEGTHWKLTQLNGTAVVPVERRAEAHVIFDGDGRFAGSDGCNRMFGSYTLEGEKSSSARWAPR